MFLTSKVLLSSKCFCMLFLCFMKMININVFYTYNFAESPWPVITNVMCKSNVHVFHTRVQTTPLTKFLSKYKHQTKDKLNKLNSHSIKVHEDYESPKLLNFNQMNVIGKPQWLAWKFSHLVPVSWVTFTTNISLTLVSNNFKRLYFSVFDWEYPYTQSCKTYRLD